MISVMSLFFWMLVSVVVGIVIGASLQRSAVMDLVKDLNDLHFRFHGFYPNHWLEFLKTKLTYSGVFVQNLTPQETLKIRQAVQRQASGSSLSPVELHKGFNNETTMTSEHEAL